MASNKINLSAGVQSNLLTLQRTVKLINTVQTRLSTGLKVNSAIDDANAFFTARALTNRADDLSSLKENIDLSISTLQAAIAGIEAITELVEQAKGLANTAKATGDTAERSLLAVQFNALLVQINNLDAGQPRGRFQRGRQQRHHDHGSRLHDREYGPRHRCGGEQLCQHWRCQ